MPSSIRAVTFDLWQTLMLDSKEQAQKRSHLRSERIYQTLKRAGRNVSPEDVDGAVHGIWEVWQTTYWDKDIDPGFEAQMVWLRQRLDVAEADPSLTGELRHAYVDPIFAVPPELEPEAIPSLTRLQARGLRLALICNTSITPGFALRRLLTGWRLDRLLPVQLFSDELGVRKPAATIFQEAARQLGVATAEMVHVGDSADTDVQGAVGAGAAALLVGPEAPLSQVVSRIGTN